MIQFEIVVETILDRWTGCELCFRPDPENGCRKHMRARVPNSLDVRHPLSLFIRFPIVRHGFEGLENTRAAPNIQFRVFSFGFWVARVALPRDRPCPRKTRQFASTPVARERDPIGQNPKLKTQDSKPKTSYTNEESGNIL